MKTAGDLDESRYVMKVCGPGGYFPNGIYLTVMCLHVDDFMEEMLNLRRRW